MSNTLLLCGDIVFFYNEVVLRMCHPERAKRVEESKSLVFHNALYQLLPPR